MFRTISMALVCLCLLPNSQPAFAQSGLALEEVVITARKREESLQDVPISVVALTSEDIEAAGLDDVFDIADFSPGLYIENVGERGGNPVFRGIVVNTAVIERQSSSVFVDGFFLSGTAATLGLQDIERVEVLKGPQSALFGRATFSGAVNFITKKPGDEFGAKVNGVIGEDDRRDVYGSVYGPLGENVSGYLSAGLYEYGGHYANTAVPGETVGSTRTKALSGVLVFNPSDSTEITLRGSFSEDDDGPPASTLLPASFDNCLFYNATQGYYCGELPSLDAVAQNNNEVFGRFGEWPNRARETTRINAQISHEFASGYEVVFRGAVNEQEWTTSQDADWTDERGVPNGLGGIGGLNFGGDLQELALNKSSNQYDDTNFEVRLASPDSDGLTWFVGVSWFEEEVQAFNLRFEAPPVGSGLPQRGVDSTYTNTGIFGSLTYPMNDQWSLGVDARYQIDDVEEQFTAVRDLSTATYIDGEFKAFLPRVSLSYAMNDTVTLYGLVSKGNKPGFFNNVSAAIQQQFGIQREVEEEEIINYEFGWKTLLADGRWLFNGSVYFLDWTNQQVRQTFLDPQGQASTATTNAGKTDAYGLELETRFQATENLTLGATLALAEAEYKTFDEPTFAPQLGVPTNLSGNTPYRYPDVQATISATYRRQAFQDYDWYVRGDLRHLGERFTDIYNVSFVGAETKVNLRTGVDNGRLKVELWATNLFDDDTPQGAFRFRDISRFTSFANTNGSFSFPYNQQVQLAEPRQVGLTASYSFGE